MRQSDEVGLMKQFLKPDWKILLTWCVLLFIFEWSAIDSWRYTGQGFAGLEEPPFYGFISQHPLSPVFWVISLFLGIPAYPLTFIFAFIMPSRDVHWTNHYWNYIYLMPYLYLVSCALLWSIRKFKGRE